MSEEVQLKNVPYYKMIANYERKKDYLYRNFWKGREYEHLAEVNALRKIFNSLKVTGTALDLGGGFGRLVPILREYLREIVLGDYSIKEITSGKDLWQDAPKEVCIHPVGLNAYKLPFEDSTFDAVVSVRLMHHIKYPRKLFKELFRVIKPGGWLVLEFAHKNHIKAVLRALLRLDFEFFRAGVYHQRHNPFSAQGVKGNGVILFDNFSYSYIREELKQAGFNVKFVVPVSFFRVPALKRLVGTKWLLKAENLLQNFGFLRVTPSLFVVAYKPKEGKPNTASSDTQSVKCVLQRLICPKHRSKLSKKGRFWLCPKGCRYTQQGEVLDLRFPPPSEVDF